MPARPAASTIDCASKRPKGLLATRCCSQTQRPRHRDKEPPITDLRFVAPGDFPPQLQASPHLAALRNRGEVVIHADRPVNDADKLARVAEADVILNTRSSVRWSEAELASLPRLRMITTCSIGTDSIDLDAATRLGIIVSNQPGRTAPVVAEHAVALMMAAARRTSFYTAELKAGRWVNVDGMYLHGKTLGIVGTGSIGKLTAEKGRALGMRVIAWTFHPDAEWAAKHGVEYVDYEELLRTSDVVSLHLKLTRESKGMLGREQIAAMKRGALVVNVGRGPLLDSTALVDALNEGRLGGAGLDVFDAEPLPPDAAILRCDNVVLTPHVADVTPEGMEMLNQGAVENVLAYLNGSPMNVVTA